MFKEIKRIMKKIILIIVVLVAFANTSCNVVYRPISTTASSVKTGEAKGTAWFGVFFKDIDVSIATAAKNGGITKIATVDHGIKIGLFRTRYFTKVTGE